LKANQKHITRVIAEIEERLHPSKALKHLSRVRQVEGVCECGPAMRDWMRHWNWLGRNALRFAIAVMDEDVRQQQRSSAALVSTFKKNI